MDDDFFNKSIGGWNDVPTLRLPLPLRLLLRPPYPRE